MAGTPLHYFINGPVGRSETCAVIVFIIKSVFICVCFYYLKMNSSWVQGRLLLALALERQRESQGSGETGVLDGYQTIVNVDV